MRALDAPANSPHPGMSPHQLVNRMKMNTVAKNQNVFFTRLGPDDAFQELVEALHQPFQEFCAPPGQAASFG